MKNHENDPFTEMFFIQVIHLINRTKTKHIFKILYNWSPEN